MRVVVVDYGVGNIFSVQAALREIDCPVVMDVDGSQVASADLVIVPGVAAFGVGLSRLRASGQAEAIGGFVATGAPLVGLCLGAQSFLDSSEEAPGVAGLGLVSGSVVRLDPRACRVPNQGWLGVERVGAPDGPALVEDGDYYYFSHGFRMSPADAATVRARARVGAESIVAVYRSQNILGAQFHPELSGPAGLAFLDRLIASVR